MFLYWEGYEIDGSDTDFSLVLPENIQILEFVECFLSIPLFASDKKPEISYYRGNKKKKFTYDTFVQKLCSGDYSYFNISKNCCHMEELSEEFQKEIYSISKRRNPLEDAYGKVLNPCTAPIKQSSYERGELTVTLCIDKEEYVKTEEELTGYVTNSTLLYGTSVPLSCIKINLGPSFYYEYAMYIMDYMIDKFPSIATYGGLDCAGGWTGGCTYASSIYVNEKINIPVKYHIKNTLKRLCEYDILCPAIEYYKGGWKRERTKDFYMVNGMPSFIESKKNLTKKNFSDYAESAELLMSSDITNFKRICKTAVSIMMPKPETFKENVEVMKELEEALDLPPDVNQNWIWMGYFCLSKENGQPMAQFRINYRLRRYFNTLLSLMEEGKIEFMKQKTYRRRHEE